MRHDPMTSDVRAEMDRFQAAWGNASKPRTIDQAPAYLFADAPDVKARKIAGLKQGREELRDLMLTSGVTRDRIAALGEINERLMALGAI